MLQSCSGCIRAGAFAEQVPGIQALAASVLRSLAQALTQAAVGLADSQHLASYIAFIFQGVGGRALYQ